MRGLVQLTTKCMSGSTSNVYMSVCIRYGESASTYACALSAYNARNNAVFSAFVAIPATVAARGVGVSAVTVSAQWSVTSEWSTGDDLDAGVGDLDADDAADDATLTPTTTIEHSSSDQ